MNSRKEMVFVDGSPMPVGERDVRYTLAGPNRKHYVPPMMVVRDFKDAVYPLFESDTLVPRMFVCFVFSC